MGAEVLTMPDHGNLNSHTAGAALHRRGRHMMALTAWPHSPPPPPTRAGSKHWYTIETETRRRRRQTARCSAQCAVMFRWCDVVMEALPAGAV